MTTLLFIGAAAFLFTIAAILAGNIFSRPVRQPVRVHRDEDLR